jgi:hypothetical protein
MFTLLQRPLLVFLISLLLLFLLFLSVFDLFKPFLLICELLIEAELERADCLAQDLQIDVLPVADAEAGE